MTSPITFLRANGIVQHYVLHGDANTTSHTPALIFINALGCDCRIWNTVAQTLAGQRRVLLYDTRGHGLSDMPSGPCEIDDYVDDLLELLDGLGIADIAVVGLSMGGLIAQRLAVRAPARLRALVLSGTAAKIGTAEAWNTRISAIEEGGIEAVADAILKRWFTPAYRADRSADVAGWRNMLVRTPVQGYIAASKAIRNADLRRAANGIGAPTLCIVGDGDGSTSSDVVRETALLIPGSRLAVIPQAGHIPAIDQPAAFCTLIEKHLRDAGVV